MFIRFSICWTRIFPTGEEAEGNELGLKFYENVIDEIIKVSHRAFNYNLS